MKKITFLSILCASAMGFSQINPVDFEAGGNGADWTFTKISNDGTSPEVMIIDNPDPSGINTSAKVAQYTTLLGDFEFQGFFTDDAGTFTIDETNNIIKIKVWKPVISDVGFKLEGGNGNLPNDIGELKVPNTVINQWEEITFDFSPYIGAAQASGLTRIVVFPDFAARTQDNTNYIDDIKFSATLNTEEFEISNLKVYPNPAVDAWTISSKSVEINQIQLFDVQGKLLRTMQPNAVETIIDGSQLTRGVYFATVNSSKGSESMKLIKN